MVDPGWTGRSEPYWLKKIDTFNSTCSLDNIKDQEILKFSFFFATGPDFKKYKGETSMLKIEKH